MAEIQQLSFWFIKMRFWDWSFDLSKIINLIGRHCIWYAYLKNEHEKIKRSCLKWRLVKSVCVVSEHTCQAPPPWLVATLSKRTMQECLSGWDGSSWAEANTLPDSGQTATDPTLLLAASDRASWFSKHKFLDMDYILRVRLCFFLWFKSWVI